MAAIVSSTPQLPDSPSVEVRRQRAAAIEEKRQRRVAEGQRRALQSQAREQAETAPRPSRRGRPRRIDNGASLYAMSVRVTVDERKRAQAAADAARLSLADYVRLQVLNETRREAKPMVVELPSRYDQRTRDALRSIADNLNRGIKIVHGQQRAGEPAAMPPQLIADLNKVIKEFMPAEPAAGGAISKVVGGVLRHLRGSKEP
jgi:hypothetical protein